MLSLVLMRRSKTAPDGPYARNTPEAECRPKPEVAQPLLFALQIGIASMLGESGIIPSATVGRVGESAA